MSAILPKPAKPAVIYPDSDGRPMAENTLQAQWILTIFGNLDFLFAPRNDVFVAMDNLWYPVEGNPKRRAAPDVYVVFGRQKGRRGSYKQWLEGGIPLHVVFEVLSPGNRVREMIRKFRFYERYGVEEYYLIDPDEPKIDAWHRVGKQLREVRVNGGLVSPRLGVRFAWQQGSDVEIFYPDGKPFLSFVEIGQARERAEQSAAEAVRLATEAARIAAEAEDQLAAANAKKDALAAKLRELGIDPDTVG